MSKVLLIIEDNYDLINLYLMAFQLQGIKPDVAETSTQAIRYIAVEPAPDVIILDLHLKGEDNQDVSGGDVYTVIRRKWPRCKVAVVSADTDWSRSFDGLAYTVVIDKPIKDMVLFVDRIKRLM